MDYSVKPGKHYVYRVRLALKNPNYQVPANQLADPKLAKNQFLITKWSDPTSVIAVPRDTRVLAVSVTPAHGNRDATGKVMLVKWVNTQGFMAHEEISSVDRGQMLNYADRKFRRTQGNNAMNGRRNGAADGHGGRHVRGCPMIAPGTPRQSRQAAARGSARARPTKPDLVRETCFLLDLATWARCPPLPLRPATSG